MTARGRQVHGFETTAAILVQNVEALHQANEIAHFRIAAGAPALVCVHHVGGTSHRGEDRVSSANAQTLRRIAGFQGKACWGFGDQRFDQRGIEANPLAGIVHIESRLAIMHARRIRQDRHAGFLEYRQARQVNAFQRVV